ncbi:MAG: hypothetical protein CME62_10485 [Halobacteriovoraceae bacterium]|nr:hypothetical protein [Halobacteriovoraceae bacterium]|tara:strand:+ start:5455 stop:6534 length:1080 start_codon:yes stop_codon:yes gene_type:complete
MATEATQKKAAAADAKSGLRRLKPSEVLFNDGEQANSLFIIQKGQLRLYKPKGKGFIEIAVLRAGEVIGEMAYFDQSGGGKRSCAAMAMVSSEVIEISFPAFAKTMQGLNPWFKTIINTLADRLRSTNARVKELESNSTSVNYSTGQHKGYEFLKSNDVIKILGMLFLVYKSHGEDHAEGYAINKRTLDLYSHEIFGIIESKLDEMMIILEDIGLMKKVNDSEGKPNVYVISDLNALRGYFIFYNTEKHLSENKKLKISKNAQIFLENIFKKLVNNPPAEEGMTSVNVSDLLNFWKQQKQNITIESLHEARAHGIVGEALIGDDEQISLQVDFVKLKKLLPNIQFMNRIQASNEEKANY